MSDQRSEDRPFLAVRETHIAGLMLAGERVFKFKKPVDFGFLDFRTRQAREAACQREFELNSRFSPDVYLGVGHFQLPASTHQTQEMNEPVVVMRRMPDERRLSQLVSSGIDVSDDLRLLARRIALVHDASPRADHIDMQATAQQLQRRWDDSFHQVREHSSALSRPQLVDDIELLAHRYLQGSGELFDHRIATGAVVDGHGDLQADDIFCLPDGPRILDCLEFDDALRYVDRIDDIAFLAMDLERLNAPQRAADFISWYRSFSGDQAPRSLLHHYIAYRAFVRAKVTCLRHAQGANIGDQADTYVDLAHRHLRTGVTRLVLVGGAPGTGKTTLANAIVERTGMVVLSSDRIRKELAGIDPQTPAAADYATGIYTQEHTQRTYAELTNRAWRLLAMGESVVLDASWTRSHDREQARKVAAETNAALIELGCQIPADQAAERITKRQTTGRSISDADPHVAASLRQTADPWPQSHPIDTSTSINEAADAAEALIWQRWH